MLRISFFRKLWLRREEKLHMLYNNYRAGGELATYNIWQHITVTS